MTSKPPQNRKHTFRNMMRKFISHLWKGQLYNTARAHAGLPLGRKLHTFKLPTTALDSERLDFFNQPSFYVSPTISSHFFDFEPKPPITSLPTSILVTLTPIPRMPDHHIASRVSPYNSLEMRLIPSSIVPISLHPPNLQSKLSVEKTGQYKDTEVSAHASGMGEIGGKMGGETAMASKGTKLSVAKTRWYNDSEVSARAPGLVEKSGQSKRWKIRGRSAQTSISGNILSHPCIHTQCLQLVSY